MRRARSPPARSGHASWWRCISARRAGIRRSPGFCSTARCRDRANCCNWQSASSARPAGPGSSGWRIRRLDTRPAQPGIDGSSGRTRARTIYWVASRHSPQFWGLFEAPGDRRLVDGAAGPVHHRSVPRDVAASAGNAFRRNAPARPRPAELNIQITVDEEPRGVIVLGELGRLSMSRSTSAPCPPTGRRFSGSSPTRSFVPRELGRRRRQPRRCRCRSPVSTSAAVRCSAPLTPPSAGASGASRRSRRERDSDTRDRNTAWVSPFARSSPRWMPRASRAASSTSTKAT